MRLAKTAIVAALALGAPPGMALAGGQNAAIEEYVLDIPSASGNDHRGGSGGPASPLSPAAESALRAQGTDGEAAADLAKATSSRGGDRGRSNGNSGLASSAGATASEEGPGLGELVAGVAGGSDSGMGPALPVILILALIGTVAFWLRRRGSKSPDA